MKKIVSSGILTLLLAGSLSACSQSGQPQAPIVQDAKSIQAGLKPSVAPGTTQTPTVQVVTTIDKKAILSQEFIYQLDLQYSTIYDKEMDLTQQSLSLGAQVARFRIAGDELQLVTDNKIHSQSDVNHPEQLLSRMKILSQTDSALTVSGIDSRASLSQIMVAMMGPSAAAAPNAQDLWIRSFEFVANGNYLLQQTSVMMADGTIGEFMESVYPRSTIAPGADFTPLQMDPTNPIGSDDGIVARYRFLPGDKIYDGETALSYAQHFDISNGATIDWYVTPNIPDEFLAPVGEAVEGWNRYFTQFKGISRKVMNFKGRLPEGIHLGDPRYNVINWDSRLVAGAAYESQDADPVTGKQSHSMIYMPAAWVQIGMDYWKKGAASDAGASATSKPTRVTKLLKTMCARDLRDAAALMASGRVQLETQDEFKRFGIELLKQTLFHEVGHALGLAHNFKGSLAYDRSNPKSLFSTSIMDYDDYEIERTAFSALDSSDGPALEYDRQAISALYNKAADVSDNDPVVPACNDAEADNEQGGVDPLCIRYDVENDPTKSVETSFNRIANATLDDDVTLAQAIRRVPGMLFSTKALDGVKTQEDFIEGALQVVASLRGVMSYYVMSSNYSFGRTVRTNIKSLLMMADGVLPDGYDAAKMRARALTGVQRALSFNELNAAVKQALAESEQAAMNQLAQSSYVKSLPAGEATALLSKIRDKVAAAVSAFETDPTKGLPRLRAAILANLARHPAVPFYFGKDGDAQVDIEATLVQILGNAVPADGARTSVERVQAAKALATYAGRPQGDAAISAALAKLQLERSQTKDNASRELVEGLIGALKGGASE